MFKRAVSVAVISAFLLFGQPGPALAAEGGTGLYLLGYRVLLSGFMPVPGIYLRNDFYWYNASASAVVIEDKINLNADIRTFVDLITVSAVLPTLKMLGADYGMALIIPTATATINSSVESGGAIDQGQSRTSGGGDIFFTPASLGWHWGNLHCIVALSMFFPAGEYKKNKDITIGKNRFALDPNIAFTWLDPKLGVEASAALGYTMNQANRTTQYKSGDEIHLDVTLAKYFKNGVAAGCGGYYYQQVTADRGNGAILGPSKGRVIALGPVVSYNTKVRGHDISLSFKYFREFDSKDRWAGNAFYLTSAVKF
jgi:hypothetical protein